MSYALGTCPTCGMAGYLTKAGLVRKHKAKDGRRQYEREVCAGSGQKPKAVVR